MTTAGLIAYGRSVRTAFGLLGTNENALTFALGYTFQKCPPLLQRFLRDVGITAIRKAALRNACILLQRTSTAAGRDITDIEVHVPGQAHVIIEAKIGLSVPGLEQCLQYLPRFRESGRGQQKLVTLIESPAMSFVEQYQHRSPELRDVLVGYQWPRLIPHCIRLQNRPGLGPEPGRWVRAFRTFLEEEYAMKCFTEEVWIVPARQTPLWPGGLSFYDTHVRGRIYYHVKARYQTKRPLYIALRTQGHVRAIQRVVHVEHEVLPATYVPELANAPLPWPREPHTIWHLSEPVQLPKPLPTGDAAMRARHVSCDLDILLSAATVREAEERMQRRKHGSEGASGSAGSMPAT